MITEDEKKTLDELYDRCGSIRSDIERVKKLDEKLKTVETIKENGVDNLNIVLVGNWGSSSCSRKPQIEASYSVSTGVPKDVVESLIRFYRQEIEASIRKLTSIVVMRTDKL
jgi:hypothetical protein